MSTNSSQYANKQAVELIWQFSSELYVYDSYFICTFGRPYSAFFIYKAHITLYQNASLQKTYF